jgi:DNA-binding IclR family transcriptional regulator
MRISVHVAGATKIDSLHDKWTAGLCSYHRNDAMTIEYSRQDCRRWAAGKIFLTLQNAIYNLFVMEERGSDNRYKSNPNQSLSKGLAVLELLETVEGEIGVREVARQLGLSTTAAHRLIATLKSHGFVEQNPYNLRYRIGHRSFQVGQSYLAQQALQQAAFERLHSAALRWGICAYLAVMRGNSVVYLLSLLNGPISVNTQPGSSTYLHSTALGKAMLSGMDAAEQEAIVGDLVMPRLTPSTIVDPATLLREVREVSSRGYAVCDTENIPDVFAIGAPVRDYTGQTVAAISFAVPRSTLPPSYREEADGLRGLALNVAADISRLLRATIPCAPAMPAAAQPFV